MDPGIFFRAESAAPALNRGLAVLAVLGGDSPLSLEALCQKLKLPKASIFRLLGALQEVGLVRKTPGKLYEALFVLRPLSDVGGLFREKIEKKMTGLCRRIGATVEWYEPVGEGMKLVGQANPDSELRVQARPGFVRRWGEELDAVARLGYAFEPAAPSLGRVQIYGSNGTLANLPRKKARELVDRARSDQWAADPHYNTNGVRRCAAAASDGGIFRGVLAVAEAYHFSHLSRTDFFRKELGEALRAI